MPLAGCFGMEQIVDRDSLFNAINSVKWVCADRNRVAILMPKDQRKYQESIEVGARLSLFEGNEEDVLKRILSRCIDNRDTSSGCSGYKSKFLFF